jgi:hypothetical protein
MNVLCVGGPVDGRRVVLQDGQRHYDLAEMDKRLNPERLPYVKHRYNLYPLHPVTRAVIFAYEKLTPTEVLEALMEGYHEEKAMNV